MVGYEKAYVLVGLFSAIAEAADSVIETINDSITLSCAHSYSVGFKVDMLFRDARALYVMQPTTDLLRILTGRSLLNQPLLADT